MNDSRKTRLKQASQLISSAIDIIKEIGDEDQEALDNLPQNLKDAEQGEAIEATIEALNDTISHLEEAFDSIDDALA